MRYRGGAPISSDADWFRAAANENDPAAEMMPAGVKASDWAAAREDFIRQAHSVLVTLAINQKDYPAAEAELTALIRMNREMNRDDAATSFQLGRAIVAEKSPDRYPVAIFHLAHAVMTTGPGALNEDARKSTEAYLEKLYSDYHGDLSGLDEVKRTSSQAWTPPPGWTIQSVVTITQAQPDAEAKFAREHPEVALWRNLKARLMAADGEAYFAADVKGSEIPNLKGKVLAQPDGKTLIVAMDFVDADASPGPEATLKFDSAVKGKVEAGTVLEFAGAPQGFTREPFMVTFEVEKAKVKGM